MIVIYETNGCLGCRKAKSWCQQNGLPYRTVNIKAKPLKAEEIKRLLAIAEDVYDVVSERSDPVANFKRIHGFPLENLSFNQLVEFLQQNPTAIRRPLITDGKVLVSGYDEDEITVLLPPEKRLSSWSAKIYL